MRSCIVYDGRPPYAQTPNQPYGRPDSRAHQDYHPPGGSQIAPGGPQAYGWNPSVYEQPGYNAYPAPPAAYPPAAESPYAHGPPPQPFVGPNAYATARPQSIYSQPTPQGYLAPGPVPYGAPVEPQGYPASAAPQQLGPQPVPHAAPELTPQPQIYPQPGTQSEQHQPQVYPQVSVQPEPQPQAQGQQQMQGQSQAPPHPQYEAQPQTQSQTQVQMHQQSQPQPQQAEAAQQSAPTSSQQSGPPYVYDPNATYADPNVQAWAQYYAHGGTDPTGAVYFISVPGVKDGPPAGAPTPSRNQSTDSVTQDITPVAQVGQVAPLNVNKSHATEPAGGQQSQVAATPPAYGASPYAPAGPASPVAGEGPPLAGQPYYGLPNQFGNLEISGDGRQNGQAGVGSQVGA